VKLVVIRFIKDYFENKQLEIRRQSFLEKRKMMKFYDADVESSNQQGFYELQRTSLGWQRCFAFIASFCVHHKKILDVGCGPYELLAVRNDEDAIGVDLSIDALKFLKNIGFRGQVIHADSLHLPFRDNSFDAVFSNQVIEHMLTIDEARSFILELQRLSSHVMVITPNAVYNRKIHDPTHFFFFTTRTLKSVTPNFEIFATGEPYSNTLKYYLVYESPKLRQIPLIGNFIVKTLDKMDSSRILNWLNKKLWSGCNLVAIRTSKCSSKGAKHRLTGKVLKI
jgi:SAM-dependent methyltransferase